MEFITHCIRLTIILSVFISIDITIFSTLSDARSFAGMLNAQKAEQPKILTTPIFKKMKAISHMELLEGEAISPFSSPPLYSPAPYPLPATNVPVLPNCVNPQPPPGTTIPNGPSPTYPPHNGPTPNQPCINLSPPINFPTPPKSVSTPPPLVNPPPIGPKLTPPPNGPKSTPSHKNPQSAVWCVAKPTVPDPIVQEAMDYACGSGADCKSIQPNGPCYKPDTMLSHASYAFNSYWQSTKAAGGTCDFGGTAMLVTIDPSFEGCEFFYNG